MDSGSNENANASMQEEVAAAVGVLVEPVLAEKGLYLFDVQFRRESVGWVLRLVIDRDEGVTVDDCAAVSREISDLLDVEDLIEHAYHLEVSSPGLNRPLRGAADYVRFKGRLAKIHVSMPDGGRQVITGHIGAVLGGKVMLVTARTGEVGIPLTQIIKANLEVEF